MKSAKNLSKKQQTPSNKKMQQLTKTKQTKKYNHKAKSKSSSIKKRQQSQKDIQIKQSVSSKKSQQKQKKAQQQIKQSVSSKKSQQKQKKAQQQIKQSVSSKKSQQKQKKAQQSPIKKINTTNNQQDLIRQQSIQHKNIPKAKIPKRKQSKRQKISKDNDQRQKQDEKIERNNRIKELLQMDLKILTNKQWKVKEKQQLPQIVQQAKDKKNKQKNNEKQSTKPKYQVQPNSDIEAQRPFQQQYQPLPTIVQLKREIKRKTKNNKKQSKKPKPQVYNSDSEAERLFEQINIEEQKRNQHQIVPEEDQMINQNDQQQHFQQLVKERKWDQKSTHFRKGKFTPQEKKLIENVLITYACTHNIDLQDLIRKLLKENTQQYQKSQRKSKICTTICASVPNRSLTSVYRFLQRQYSKSNHRGPWTEDQQHRLIDMIEKLGTNWKQIAKHFNRTKQNVRDKYRQLGEHSMESIEKFWKFEELVHMLKIIEEQTNCSFLSQSIDNEILLQKQHDTINMNQLKQKRYNSYLSKKQFIFQNMRIIQNHIQTQQFNQINTSLIRWNDLADQLHTKTALQCKNKFLQFMQISLRQGIDAILKDLQILNFIKGQNVILEQDINWDNWQQQKHFNNFQAQNRWKVMKKNIFGKNVGSLQQCIKVMWINLKNRKHIQTFRQEQMNKMKANNELI